jgi:predicted helicase
VRSTAIQTSRDAFAIDLDRDALESRIAELVDEGTTDEDLRQRYGLEDGRNWSLPACRRALRADPAPMKRVVPMVYRPFDTRYTHYGEALMNWPRRQVMDHMTRPNLALLAPRQLASTGFRHVLCSSQIAEMCVISARTKEQNYVAPLYLYPDAGSFEAGGVRRSNLSPAFTASLARILGLRSLPDGTGDLTTTFGPEDAFSYIYAVLHSPSYRERYVDFLKIDFPRIPLPGSRELFAGLCARGQELVDLHLLRSEALDHTPARFEGSAPPQVVKVSYDPDAEAVRINPSCRFVGIAPEVWGFHVGGYQVLNKWLKDRGPKKGNPGRVLTEEDLRHYCRVVMALQETIRLMSEIDETIEAHGGWPGAFASGGQGR